MSAHRGLTWGGGLGLLVAALLVALLFWRHDRALAREGQQR